jgi:hypothetical protein
MRMIGLWAVLILAAGAMAGTAHAQKVSTDWDHKADFSQYRTFMWLRQPRMEDPLMRQRVMDVIDAQLTGKGVTQVAEGADLGLVVNGATSERRSLTALYDDFPGWKWSWAGEASAAEGNYTVGTLIVDAFDTRTKQVVWRGIATDTLSNKPDKNAEKMTKAVGKMFKSFPPREHEALDRPVPGERDRAPSPPCDAVARRDYRLPSALTA